jgi:hypothetical protein
LQEDVDDDYQNNPGLDTRVQHVWGLRHIDDPVQQRRAAYASGSWGAYTEYFHLTDAQYSTVALVDGSGAIKERVQYSAYGQAAQARARDEMMAFFRGGGPKPPRTAPAP